MTRNLIVTSAMAAFVALTTSMLEAAPIEYGDYSGDNVDYLGVQEESSTDPGEELFGAPTIAGDTIDFNPQGFAASSTGVESDTTDSNLQFTIMAKPGQAIDWVNFSEAGDTTLSGLSGEAQATVGASIFIDVQEVNVGGVATPVSVNLDPVSLGFVPTDDFKLSELGAGTTTWTGGVTVSLTDALADKGVAGMATKVFVSLDNTLTAASVAGTSAFIQKKDADALVVTTGTIPEPTSLTILAIAAMVGGLSYRRK